MPNKGKIDVDLIFVAHRTGTAKRTQKPYNFVELSNGLRSKLFNVKNPDIDFSEYSEGDTISANFEVDVMKEEYNIDLVGIG